MGAFSRGNIVNAIVSATVGTALTLTFQPFVARAQESIVSPAGLSRVDIRPPPVEPSPVEPPSVEPPSVEPPPPPSSRLLESKKKHAIHEISSDKLVFHAFILTQELRWKIDSSREVIYPSGDRVFDLRDYLKRHLTHRLSDAQDVISIGMASCEGSRDSNEVLAGDRAEMLKLWLHEARPDDKNRNFYIVNLGQYKKHECHDGQLTASDTSRQRRIVILYVIRKEDSDSKESLATKILQQLRARKELLFDPEDYSKDFALTGDGVKS